MRYKVWSGQSNCRKWKFQYFKEDARAKEFYYFFNLHDIDHVIYETDEAIPQKLFDQYDFNYEIID